MTHCVLLCINLTEMQEWPFFWGGCIGKALENYISDGVTVNPFLFKISHASSSHLEFQSFPSSSAKSINKPSLALPVSFFPFLADDPFPTLCSEESEGQLPHSLEDFGLLNVLCHMKTYKYMTFNLF